MVSHQSIHNVPLSLTHVHTYIYIYTHAHTQRGGMDIYIYLDR